MVRYAFDLYPRTDPRDGAVVRRFEHLLEASYRAEENGTGSGQIKVAGDSADGEDIDPRGLQYVRVLEIDDSDVETVKGGFWLEQGKFQALTRKETKHLEFGGAGTLAYLQRAVMWSRTYIHGVFTGQDPIGTTWNLANQSTFYANGNHLGAMLWRVIYEAQHFQSGSYTHRHFDGTTHTGTHADDRTESAIPDVVMTFDQNEDSSGNPWTLTAGTFTAQVGESVLSVVRRLMEMGLKVEMDPDTFELNAWEAPHRTDRTSTTWASGKVLFQAPTAEDIDTGNILSDTIRTIRAFIKRSIVLAGSENIFAISEGATDIPWEGGYRVDTDDTATAASAASRQRLARSDAVDHLKVVMKLGNAPLQGRYRPWVHVNPGDLVTVDTGSDQWEFDTTTFPVAALTVELKEGGDWRAIAELGSSFTSLLEPAFQTGSAPAHSHPPNPELCRPGQPGGTPEVEASDAFGDSASGYTLAYTIAGGLTDSYLAVGVVVNPISQHDMTEVVWRHGTLSSTEEPLTFLGRVYGPSNLSMEVWGLANPTASSTGSSLIRVITGVSSDRSCFAAATLSGVDSVRLVTGASGTGAASSVTAAALPGDLVLNWGGIADQDPLTAASGLTEIEEYQLATAVRRTSIALGEENATGTETSGWTHVSFPWVSMSAVFAGGGASSADLPLPTVETGQQSTGYSVRAARCDHQHEHGLLSEDGTHYHDVEDIDGLSDSFSHVYDPRTYGAVGDGSTDDTTALQAAIDDAEVVGGTVNGGGKTYLITATLEFLSNSRVMMTNLTLKFGSGVTAVKVSALAGGGAHGVIFDHVYWWSTSTTGTVGLLLEDQDRVTVRASRIDDCAVGIDFHPSAEWVEGTALEDVWVNGCTTGIRFFNAGTNSFHETSFRNVGINNCPTGIEIQQDSQMYRCDWVNVSIWPPNGGTGVLIDGDMEGFRASIGFDGAAASGGAATGFELGANALNLGKADIWTQYESAMAGVTFTPVDGVDAHLFHYHIGVDSHWEPVTTNPGGGPELVWDGDDLVMTWVT